MFATQQKCEELYDEKQEAIISASLYAFEALNYMRLYKVREEDKVDILAFNDFVIALKQLNFTQMKYTCEEMVDKPVFRVKIAVLVNGRWQSASYYCRTLPEGKFSVH